MNDLLSKIWDWTSQTFQDWVEEYETTQRNQKERQKQLQAEQQRLAMLEPAAIYLDQHQQTGIADCFRSCASIPSSALPPLILTHEQSIRVTEHMLRQIVEKQDNAEAQWALAILIQGGMLNLGPTWHSLYHDLYQTMVAPFVNIPFNNALAQPYLEVTDTPQYVVYKFQYDIGPYSGAVYQRLQQYCKNGIQTAAVLAIRQTYGLTNIGIGWNAEQEWLVIAVC